MHGRRYVRRWRYLRSVILEHQLLHFDPTSRDVVVDDYCQKAG